MLTSNDQLGFYERDKLQKGCHKNKHFEYPSESFKQVAVKIEKGRPKLKLLAIESDKFKRSHKLRVYHPNRLSRQNGLRASRQLPNLLRSLRMLRYAPGADQKASTRLEKRYKTRNLAQLQLS